VQEANKLLDWDVPQESTERNRTLFRTQREAFEQMLGFIATEQAEQLHGCGRSTKDMTGEEKPVTEQP
jgi:hypothetical protein